MAVKQAVDAQRVPGRYLLSGSANFSLLPDVSESLAGRALYLSLYPFTRRERTGRLETTPWLGRFLEPNDDGDPLREPPLTATAAGPVSDGEILDGGLPPVVLGETNSREL